MTIYVFLAIFPFFLGFFFPKLNEQKKQKRLYFIICGAVMLFIMGCRRYSLGSVDTYHYCLRMYQAINSETWQQFYEPNLYEKGFQLFMFAASRVFHHYQWILIVSSLFYIVSLFYFADHNSDDIPLSVTLYISLGLMIFELQGMRQAMAMSLCLFAYEQAKNRKFLRFLLLVMLASTFHRTAIIFIFVYWIAKLKMNKLNVPLIFCASLLVTIFPSSVVDLGNKVFNETYSGAVTSGGFVAVAIYGLALIVCGLYYTTYDDNVQSPLVLILMAGTFTYVMRYTGVQVAERISFYFAFSQIALIPLAAKLVVPRDRLFVRIMIVALATGLFAYRLGDSGFLPYAFFWS